MWYASPLCADLQAQDLGDLPGGLEVLAGLDQVLDGGRGGRGQLGVADQRQVLHGVRHAVDLPVEGDRLERGSLRRRTSAAAVRLHRVDRAVLDQVADPVVRADHDVRAAALLRGGDEGWSAGLCDDLLDLDGDAVLLAELLGEGLERGGALVVGPDHQLAVALVLAAAAPRGSVSPPQAEAPSTRPTAATTPAVRMARMRSPVVLMLEACCGDVSKKFQVMEDLATPGSPKLGPFSANVPPCAHDCPTSPSRPKSARPRSRGCSTTARASPPTPGRRC